MSLVVGPRVKAPGRILGRGLIILCHTNTPNKQIVILKNTIKDH